MSAKIYIPSEVWLHIFSYLTEESLRKSATLVCKTWFYLIRNDLKLSGTLTLHSDEVLLHTGARLNFLRNWPKLKVLRFAGNSTDFFVQKGIEDFPLLEKIVLVKKYQLWHFPHCVLEGNELCLVKDENGLFPLKLKIEERCQNEKYKAVILDDCFYDQFKFIENLNLSFHPDYPRRTETLKKEVRQEFKRIMELIFSRASNLRKIKSNIAIDFVMENVLKKCPKMEEISLNNRRGKVDVDFLQQFTKVRKLKDLSLTNFLDLQIPFELSMNNLTSLTIDCCGFQDFKSIPKTFPRLQELNVFFGRCYTTLRKHCRGFLDMISCINDLKDLRFFMWQVVTLEDNWINNRDTKIWANTFEENGHQVLKELKKLHLNCFVNIELKTIFSCEEVYKTIQSFTKSAGKKPYWIRHRIGDYNHWTDSENGRVIYKDESNEVCSGDEGCNCEYGSLDVTDYSTSEEDSADSNDSADSD